MRRFLSEKFEARRAITVVTSTSGEDFAAKNPAVYDPKPSLEMDSNML
ncbi:hypothetical protein BH23PAT1_BH23PAT1_1670 [soil metagenome]